MISKGTLAVVGIGPGNPKYITAQAVQVMSESDQLIGSRRQTDDISRLMVAKKISKLLIEYQTLEELKSAVNDALKKGESVAVLASGDPTIYGIASYLRNNIPQVELLVVSGISSTQLLCAKSGINMNDALITSAHGRIPNLDLLAEGYIKKMILLTDASHTPYDLAQECLQKGCDPMVYVGSRMGYDDELIAHFWASDVPISYRQYSFCAVALVMEDEK